MAKMGRPKIEIDKEQFEKLCGILCTLEEIAGWFKCSHDTIENWCKKEYGQTFSYVHKNCASIGKTSLRRAQYQTAIKGNPTMLVWLGKQWLGQSDNPEGFSELEDMSRSDREVFGDD